jgi:hypothetical protein
MFLAQLSDNQNTTPNEGKAPFASPSAASVSEDDDSAPTRKRLRRKATDVIRRFKNRVSKHMEQRVRH